MSEADSAPSPVDLLPNRPLTTDEVRELNTAECAWYSSVVTFIEPLHRAVEAELRLGRGQVRWSRSASRTTWRRLSGQWSAGATAADTGRSSVVAEDVTHTSDCK